MKKGFSDVTSLVFPLSGEEAFVGLDDSGSLVVAIDSDSDVLVVDVDVDVDYI